ncbi:MAG TPA: STAS domain-containing protein [Roseiflexaceae bacterium]|nr:STAS domain-containing protein [Roseiflexaceae bacterium]
MSMLLARWLTIQHSDEDIRRRGRTLVILCTCLIVVSLLAIPVMLSQPNQQSSLVSIGASILVFLTILLLARAGWVTAAAALLVGVWLLLMVGGPLVRREVLSAPIFVAGAILLAGVTMRPWAVAPVLAICLATLFLVLGPIAREPQPPLSPVFLVRSGTLLCLVAALIAAVGSTASSRALDEARAAREAAERAASERDRLNATLEAQVADRTAALEAALRQVQQHADRQAALLNEVAQHRTAIRALSVPVLPVDRDTLVLPLIGALDSARLAEVQEQALDAIQRVRAQFLILDITGTPVVDSQVAQGLIAIVHGARLLGAQVWLVGIRPEVAQAIVGLGLDLSDIPTFSSLQNALERHHAVWQHSHSPVGWPS